MLLLNLHFHVLVPEAAWVADGEGARRLKLRRLRTEDVTVVVRRIARRVRRLVAKHDGTEDETDLVERLRAGSQRGLVALGPRAGKPVRALGGDEAPRERRRAKLCAAQQGFDVHAGKLVRKGDRDTLEKLCRYGLRGPIANARLSELAGGKLLYDLKRPLPSGATHLVLERGELLEKLAALLPNPREHLTVYSGVFAGNAKLRAKIVPKPRLKPLVPRAARRSARSKWAELLKRIFKFDALVCPKCGGPRRVLEALHEPDAIERILRAQGLPTTLPVRAPARAPPQQNLFDAAAQAPPRDDFAQPSPPDDFSQPAA